MMAAGVLCQLTTTAGTSAAIHVGAATMVSRRGVATVDTGTATVMSRRVAAVDTGATTVMSRCVTVMNAGVVVAMVCRYPAMMGA